MLNNSNGLKILRLILLILVSAILLVCIESTVRVYDNDLWVHLKYGEHFFLNHTWSIDHSVFSWTPATREWKYVTWIGSGIMYVMLESSREAHFRVLQSNWISSMFFGMRRAFPENTCCSQCCVAWGRVFSGVGRLKS